MAKALIFNTSSVAITVSINNGSFFEISAADASSWLPSVSDEPVTFVANTTPSPGQIGLGGNMVSCYPSGGSPAESSIFTLSIPTNTFIESLQLYLFRSGQEKVAWVTNINGAYCDEGSGS